MKNHTSVNVLIIEDNPGDTRLIREFLSETVGVSFDTESVGTLSHGLDALLSGKFDLVLLDLSLPDSSGFGTLAKVRSQVPETAVIVLTGLNDEETAIKAVRAGAQDYLIKGQFESDLLSRAIQYAVERKRLESRLRQAHKMEAVGVLAGGIAHQFNNALYVITGNIDLLESDFPGDEKVANYSHAMRRSARRMTHLTAQLLAYAEGGKYQVRTVSMGDFIKKTLASLRHSLGPDICADTVLPRDILYVRVDPAQIRMALSAVLINASEAMEGKGRIRIACENKILTHEMYACLTITDHGTGMDEETRKRVFEPFFTTKFEGRGLGMAAAYGIVRNHDGHIRVDSEWGRGTSVRICLPLAESPPSQEP